jgi:ankyrin repeat protein
MIYNQITQSGTRSKAVGERVLKWLMATQRPLKIQELRAAVSVEDDGHYSPLTTRDILAMTCNLVVEDTELGIFRYAHTSVLEYLEKRPEFDTSQVNVLLLARCMDVLLHSPISEHSQCPGDSEVCMESLFEDYASEFWLQHCVSCSDQDRQRGASSKIKAFLYNGLQKSEALYNWEKRIRYWRLCDQRGSVEWIVSLLYRESRRGLKNPTHWYLTCTIGLTEIIEEMSISEINTLNVNLRFSKSDGELNLELYQTKGLGMNGLHMAILGSNEATVYALLRKGVSISQRTDSNATCLSLATTRNNSVVVDLLCAAGADPNESCPVKMKNTVNMINQVLLDIKPSDSGRRPPTAMGFRQNTRTVLLDEDIETPLHSAAFFGKKRAVMALLKWGADINARSCLGSTVLHKAMEGDHQRVAIHLIKAGADASTPLLYGRTPLHLAAAMGQSKLAECILQHGGNALARDHFGKTALEIARRYGHHSIVEILEHAAANMSADEVPGSSYFLGATMEEFEAAEREERELSQAYLGNHEPELSDTEETVEYSILRSEAITNKSSSK